MQTLQIKTGRRTQFLDITSEIQSLVTESKVKSGLLHLYVPHTTAAISINEHADPDVARDVEAAFDRLIPERGPYRHSEGNSDSHIKIDPGRQHPNRLHRRKQTGPGPLARHLLL
jgi:secondary thiamine-phosphate synthase enzyme